MNAYEKFKFIIEKFVLKANVAASDANFQENGISQDTVESIFTILKKAKIIYKLDKETNKIESNLINKNFFYDNQYNVNLLASIVSREKDVAKSTVDYVFKSVPQKILSMINNNYMKTFQNGMIKLLDEKKYHYFANIIQVEGRESSKSICDIFDCSENLYKRFVPLEIFIYENSWYVCGFNVSLNQLQVIDSLSITESKITANYLTKVVSDTEINKFIENYITKNNFQGDRMYLIRLKPETLTLLTQFEIVTDYEIYKDEYDGAGDRSFVDNNLEYTTIANQNKKHLFKIDFNDKDFNSDSNFNIKNDEVLYFSRDDSRKYYIKINCSQAKINMILARFKDIEILNIDNYVF